MKLTNKNIVITGASSGIGFKLTQRLIKAGANIVAVSRHPEIIKQEFGERVYALKCDLSKHEEIDVMLEEAESYLGTIDIYIANAGFAYYGPMGEADWEKNKAIFDTNVLSTIYTLQKLATNRDMPLTYMITISALGKMVLPGFALYDSTKFALDGFVRTYRMERPDNIRIIPVYPVATLTRFFNRAGGKDVPVPFPRQTPDYVAWTMEMGIRLNMRSVYPSLIFILRCILVRIIPIDLIPQAIDKIRFKKWRKNNAK